MLCDVSKRKMISLKETKLSALENVMTEKVSKMKISKTLSSMRYSMYGDIKDDKEELIKNKREVPKTHNTRETSK